MIVAAIQLGIVTAQKAANIERAVALVRRAVKDHQAALVTLPEMFVTGYDWKAVAGAAEPLTGPTVSTLCSLAAELQIHLLAGSIPEQRGGDRYNTSVLIGPDGQIITQYSKIHLFGLMDETEHLKAGSHVVAADSAVGKLGLSICYDLRFPELFRQLTDLGAQVVLVPAEWPHPRLEHWRTLLIARAIENQCFVIGNNRSGKDGSVAYCGHSMIIDPWGVPLAEAGEGEQIIHATIDLELVKEVRKRVPALLDRKLH